MKDADAAWRWCAVAVLVATLGQGSWASQRPKVRTIPRPATNHPSVAFAQALSSWDIEQRRLARACARDARQVGTPWQYAIEYTVLLDSPQVYSVAFHLEQYCREAHFEYIDRSVMFDARTGERVQARGVFKQGLEGVGLVPEVHSLLLAARQARLDSEQRAYGCEEILRNAPEEYVEPDAVALGKTGLNLMYIGPNVVRYCYGTVVLPYSQLPIGRTGWNKEKLL